MHLRIKEMAGGQPILAGSLRGKKLLASLLEQAGREPDEPEAVFLDFAGVQVATASFLRESVLRFREIVRRRRSNIYPVVANAQDQVQEELEELLRSHGAVLLACGLDEQAGPTRPVLIGELEPKQRATFDLVCERGETSASELMRDYGDNEGVSQTAWNNRLTTLAALGVVVEVARGRSRRYKPLLGGL